MQLSLPGKDKALGILVTIKRCPDCELEQPGCQMSWSVSFASYLLFINLGLSCGHTPWISIWKGSGTRAIIC